MILATSGIDKRGEEVVLNLIWGRHLGFWTAFRIAYDTLASSQIELIASQTNAQLPSNKFSSGHFTWSFVSDWASKREFECVLDLLVVVL